MHKRFMFCFIMFIGSYCFKHFQFCYEDIGLVIMTEFHSQQLMLNKWYLLFNFCQPPLPTIHISLLCSFTYWPYILKLFPYVYLFFSYFPFFIPSHHGSFSSSWTLFFYSHTLLTCDIYLGTRREIIFNIQCVIS